MKQNNEFVKNMETKCEICGEPRPNLTRDALIKLGWCGANIDAETKTHKIKRAVTFCQKHGTSEVTDRLIKLIRGDNVPMPNEAAKEKMNGWHVEWVLEKRPKLVGKLDTSKIEEDAWDKLLKYQPQLEKFRKTKKKKERKLK